jgi:hypothetical protein
VIGMARIMHRYYTDITLRPPTKINPYDFHNFSIEINEEVFKVEIDDFVEKIAISDMPRVNGPGLVRFHATRSWMGIGTFKLRATYR